MSGHINLNNGVESNVETPENGEWECQICKDSSKSDNSLPEQRPPIWWRIGGDHSDAQKKLGGILESRRVHIVVVILVLLDLSLILTDLVLFAFYPLEEEAPEAVRTAGDVFAWISVGILSFFTLEQLTKLAVFGPSYFLIFWHALDAFVIIASLVLEIVLRGAAREVTSLLIIFRLWRLVRIMHSIAEEVTIENEERMRLKVDEHHRLEMKMQQRINELEKQLNLPLSLPVTLNGSSENNNSNSNRIAHLLHGSNDIV